MQLTKFEHACLDVRENSDRLVIDPGVFSESFNDFASITGLVITHSHADHFDSNKVQAILAANPKITVYTTSEVAKELPDSNVIVPEPGKAYEVGGFRLQFFGKDHEIIDATQPPLQNVGVLVNDKLYYPGDSFTPCSESFIAFAAPVSGPWFKVKELVPLLEQSSCSLVFGTHDGLLNEVGYATTNKWLDLFSKRAGKKYRQLKPGESIEI